MLSVPVRTLVAHEPFYIGNETSVFWAIGFTDYSFSHIKIATIHQIANLNSFFIVNLCVFVFVYGGHLYIYIYIHFFMKERTFVL